MGRKPVSYPGTLVVPTQRLRLRRPSAPVLLGGVCLVLVGALCAYLRLGLVLSALVEIVTFGAMREARLRRALLESRAARNELRLAIDTIPTIVWSTTADGTVNFVNRAWRDFTDRDATVPVTVASSEVFAADATRLGIGATTTVVAYDDYHGVLAGRIVWVLRSYGHLAAFVLDGGLATWRAAGHELATGAVEPRPSSPPHPVPNRLEGLIDR